MAQKHDLDTIKKQFKKERWIEDIHKTLKTLPESDAAQLVDSLSNLQVFRNVNVRRMQEDYIADYLQYLWKISPKSFWRHFKSSLNSVQRGLLWGGDMDYMTIAVRNHIPDDIWKKLIAFAVDPDIGRQDKDAIACIIQGQCKRFNRKDELDGIIIRYSKSKRQAAKDRIDELMNARCNYYFV